MNEFTVSVSRMAKGKAGYKRNKFQFGWSFYPEAHTSESLIRLAAVEGYSFLAGEFDRRPPSYYGRSDVTTARITENFRQTRIIPLDDDGHATNAVTFWENDPLFTTYGAGYYHSSSSTPEAPRIRPLFELDEPITDGSDYQLARRALAWHYNRFEQRLDPVPQIPQVWYGSLTPTQYRIFGGVLPVEYLAKRIVKPYRAYLLGEKMVRDARQEPGPRRVDGAAPNIDGAIKWYAQLTSGRHTALLWLGGIAHAAGVKWIDVNGDVIAACVANGYYDTYAQSDREVERVFLAGRAK